MEFKVLSGPVLLTTDNKVSKIDYLEDERLWLAKLQQLVEGYIELAPLNWSTHYMLVNEEGRNLNLPLNQIATLIIGKNIFGNAVLLPKEMFK